METVWNSSTVKRVEHLQYIALVIILWHVWSTPVLRVWRTLKCVKRFEKHCGTSTILHAVSASDTYAKCMKRLRPHF